MIHGVDISRYQELYTPSNRLIQGMDFEKMLSKKPAFIFARLSVGTYYKDISFERYYQAFYSKIPFGVYHVVRCGAWEDQKEWILRQMNDRIFDLPLILDLEYWEGNAVDFTDTVQKLCSWYDIAFNEPCIIYTNKGWSDTFLKPWSGWKRFPLFVASYLNGNSGPGINEPGGVPYMPRLWSDYVFWQWSADKPKPNKMGPEYGARSISIDRDVFKGDEAGWLEFWKSGNYVPPVTSTPKVKVIAPLGLNVRIEPSEVSKKIGAIPANSIVDVLERQSDILGRIWDKIVYNNQFGWIADWFCEPVE